jgi:hypothetical protein
MEYLIHFSYDLEERKFYLLEVFNTIVRRLSLYLDGTELTAIENARPIQLYPKLLCNIELHAHTRNGLSKIFL